MIDLQQIILDLFPNSIRNLFNSEFLRAQLIPARDVRNDFSLFENNFRYKAAADASTISLRHHIERELDVRCSIEEIPSGKPADFVIKVDSVTDLIRIMDIANRYKLTGRSFVVAIAGMQWTYEFIDHVTENLIVAWTYEFIDHVTESLPDRWIDSYAEYDEGQIYFYINSSMRDRNPVMKTVEINVTYLIRYCDDEFNGVWEDDENGEQTVSVSINSGTTSGGVEITFSQFMQNRDFLAVNITKQEVVSENPDGYAAYQTDY